MKIYALAGWSHTRFFLPWRAGGFVLHSCPREAEPALTDNKIALAIHQHPFSAKRNGGGLAVGAGDDDNGKFAN